MKTTKFYLTKRKQAGGIFYIGVRDETGKIKWRTTGQTNKSDALEVFKKFKKELPNAPDEPTLSQFIAICEQRLKGSIRVGTLDSYREAMTDFLTVCGDRYLSTYSLNDVETLKTALANGMHRKDKDGNPILRKSKEISINIKLRGIKACFNRALKWDMIDSNPLRKMELLRVKQKPPVYMNQEQLTRVLSEVQQPLLKRIIVFACQTGCRLGECRNLLWKNVDFERREFRLVNLKDFEMKSGKAQRTIPMTTKAYDVLREQYMHRSSERAYYVFEKPGTNKRVENSWVSHQFKKCARQAKLPQFHFHHTRHTFGSMAVQRGIPIYTVQALMGHSSVTTTSLYAGLAASTLHDEIRKLDT